MTNEALDFTGLIQAKTQDFTGREWLVQEVKQFLNAGPERYFMLCGEPGIGKTCFIAHLVEHEKYLHHFISAQDLDWYSPVAFAYSLAAQFAHRYGGWVLSEDTTNINVHIEVGTVATGGSVTGVTIGRYEGLSVEEEFRRLVVVPLKRLSQAGKGPVTLVIDGLDEAAAYRGSPPINELLGRLGAAPSVRLLITANPGPVIDEFLQALAPDEQIKVDLDGLNPHNLEDCRSFLEAAVRGPEIAARLQAAAMAPAHFIEQALRNSEGNFLYLSYLLEALKKGMQIDLDDLPTGLEQVYSRVLSQVARPVDPAWIDLYTPILGLLAVAPRPLTKVEIGRLAGISAGDTQKALNDLLRFLEFDNTLPLNRQAYRLYHQAFARFLLDPDRAGNYWIDPQEVHRQVVVRLLPPGADPAAQQDEYALRFLAYHLRRAGADHFSTLFAMITPQMYQAVRKNTGSNLVFHLDLGEAIGAALQLPMPDRLISVARLGLIDASLVSRVANLPPGLLAELAWAGTWQRASELAHSSTGGEAAGLEAVVTGMLAISAQPPIDKALELAGSIPLEGEGAYYRSRALARVGKTLAVAGDSGAQGAFESAEQAAMKISETDQQVRALAFLAGRAFGSWDKARELFSQTLDLALSMPVELESDTQEAVMTANLVAQKTVLEAEWNLQRTPFDTLGAKARALADLAAEMHAVGLKAQSEQAFAAADELVQHMTGRPIDEVYRQHTQDYIAARRAGPSGEGLPQHPRRQPELEAELLASERLPVDHKGFYPRVLVTAARLLADAGDARAGDVLERAGSRLNAVEGGYQAQLLLEMASLERKLGREEQAAALERRAQTIARGDPGLLAGYQKWLAQVGRTQARSMRQIAGARGALMKARYFSDQALANLAIALADEDLEAARVLAGEIQDDLQRARAFAGMAAQAPPEETAGLLEAVRQFHRELDERQVGFVLYEAALAAAPLRLATALELAHQVVPADLRALALVEIARTAEALQQPAGSIWEEAKEAAQAALTAGKHNAPGPSLAYALALLGKHSAADQLDQAEVYWQAALEAARREPGGLMQVSALTKVASALQAVHPERARQVLAEAERLAWQLNGLRDCGRALSDIYAQLFPIDETAAMQNLASLRSLGRVNFLDGLEAILAPAAERYGAGLAWQVFQALEQAEAFIPEDTQPD